MAGILRDVCEVVPMHLVLSDASVLPITAELSFEAGDPYSVRIVFTPGHTAGHCSVILRLTERDVLLTADAAYSQRTIAETAAEHVDSGTTVQGILSRCALHLVASTLSQHSVIAWTAP